MEKRTYFYTTHLDQLVEAKVGWTKLKGIGMVKRETIKVSNPTKTTTETAYFIGSVDNITDFPRRSGCIGASKVCIGAWM